MNKSGDIVILNDLKKEREDVKKQYEEQKKKKFTDKHAMLYCIGFAGVFVATCIICPANFYACASILVGYGFGVPCAFAYSLFSKEEKLKRKINKLNKDIDKLEFELVGIKVNHHYIDQEKGFVLEENRIVNNKPIINSVICDEEPVQEDEENSHAFGSLDDYSDCLLDDKIESKMGEEFDMKDEIREDLWETVVSEHPEFGVRHTDVPYEMKGLYPTTKTAVVPRSYKALAVPCKREHVFIMSRDEATSRASDESLTRISSMSQEFEQNNLGCPKLIKK